MPRGEVAHDPGREDAERRGIKDAEKPQTRGRGRTTGDDPPRNRGVGDGRCFRKGVVAGRNTRVVIDTGQSGSIWGRSRMSN